MMTARLLQRVNDRLSVLRAAGLLHATELFFVWPTNIFFQKRNSLFLLTIEVTSSGQICIDNILLIIYNNNATLEIIEYIILQ